MHDILRKCQVLPSVEAEVIAIFNEENYSSAWITEIHWIMEYQFVHLHGEFETIVS